MRYGGVDEAGYGPLLGPLCVGMAVFDIDHSTAERPRLWSMLKRAVTRAGRDGADRIAIDDSKKLKGAKNARMHPLSHLERGVLCMLAVADEDRSWLESCTDLVVLERLGVSLPDVPWYGGEPIALPLGRTPGQLRIDSGMLARALDEASVQAPLLRVRALSVPEYNRRVSGSGSKSWVNFEAACGLIEHAWAATPAPLHLVMDRHGGRTSYQRSLRTAWPDATVDIQRESESQSDYRLGRGAQVMHLHIRSGADGAYLPAALASMAAKLVRELLMLRLNRFFASRVEDLQPTAGYVQDGRRWLADVAGLLQTSGFDQNTLVRCR
jgi:ribonuclease HII